MSETLEKLSNGGSGLPCCGLAAMALVTRTPLTIMYLHYRARFKKPKQWRGGTYFYNTIRMLRLYQLDFVHSSNHKRELKGYMQDNPSMYAVVRTTGHVQTVLGQLVSDQNGTKHIDDYHGKNKHVLDVLKIKDMPDLPLAYRALMLVNDEVCTSMQEAYKLYEPYQ